jgi:hypothetical protein
LRATEAVPCARWTVRAQPTGSIAAVIATRRRDVTQPEGRRLLGEAAGARDELSARLGVLDEARPGLRLRVEAQAVTPEGGILGDLEGADIEALAFIVLMEASKSAQDDLKAIMSHVEAINTAKDRVRSYMASIGAADRTPSGVTKSPCPAAAEATDLDTVLPILLMAYGADLDHELDQLAGDLDATTEISDELGLRLQMAMDRRAKMMSTLANIMKKVADTSDQIVRNLK